MSMLAFGARNRKEILRDPVNLAFGIGFPVALMAMISMMARSIADMPGEVFGIASFAPGMAVFSLSFLSLFLGSLIAGDRASSYLMRLFASPLTAWDYLLGYSLPLLPVAAAQSAVCFVAACLFGLTPSWRLLLAVAALIPVAMLFIALGLLLGALLTARAVGGAASILVNVCAFLSGTWFDVQLIGGAFANICYALPFYHAVEAVKAAAAGQMGAAWPHLGWVLLYAAALFALAAWIFRRKMQT